MTVRPSASDIEKEAARWVMRIDRDGRTPALEVELRTWLDQDTRHVGAFLQAEAAWSVLDRARLIPENERAAAREYGSVPRRGLLAGGMAATAAAVVAGLLLVGRPEIYTTGVGEIRRLPLADGSTASINTSSRLEVDFGTRLRRVRLDDGEAWFQVAKDPDRPFRVDIGRIRVQATGTAFSVRRVADEVEVRVTEGRVRAWVDDEANRTVDLTAGSTVVLSARGGAWAPVIEPADIDRDLAWRSGRIDLAGETLGEAVTEFNRYNTRALVVDERLRDEQLFGIFRLDDPAGFAASVALSLDADVTADRSTIRIAPRDG